MTSHLDYCWLDTHTSALGVPKQHTCNNQERKWCKLFVYAIMSYVFSSYSGGRTGKIINHDVRIAEHIVSTLHEHTQDVCGLAWSPDGRMLASGGNDNLLNIWSPLVVGQLPLHSLTHHQAAVKVSIDQT